MPSIVDICNLALGKLNQDVPIAALTDRTKEARLFSRIYDLQRDLVLSERIWPFATKAVALAVEDEAPMIGWAYRYAYPEDCIQALDVCGEYGVRAGLEMARGACTLQALADMSWPGRTAWDTHYGDQGTSISSDLEFAYLIYVMRVEDAGRYSTMFVEALACKLALEAAPSIIGELGQRLKASLESSYEYALSKASANAQNESREAQAFVSPTLASRL